MKKPVFLQILLVLVLIGTNIAAQDKERISRPVLSVRDSLLHITYSIENSTPGTRYIIRVEITGQDGTIIEARHLSGDVGTGVIGGTSRQITWDYPKDLPGMRQALDVSVQIWGSREEKARVYSSSALLLRSLVLPGWGPSTLDSGKPYWILGVAGYGAVIASVSLNQRSNSNYQLYLDETTGEQRDHYFQLQEKQKKGSKICAATAAGIWVSGLAWTYIKSRNTKQLENFDASMRFRSNPENSSVIPEFLLVYSF